MKGFILTENEKKQIRSLYSDKGLIIEQNEKPDNTQTKTDCISVEVIGSFDVMVTENPDNIKNFITKLNEQIGKNELLKKAYDDGKLYVGEIKLMGGASNRYGGKVVRPTMDNQYNPKEYAEDPKKYTGDFSANLKLAEDRAKNVWAELQTLLPNNNIQIPKGVVPTFEQYVIDTNGATDKTNQPAIDSKKFNAGQIVKMTVDLCGTERPSTDIIKCFESATIEVHFEQDKPGNIKHDCNKAVYEIYANGVLLYNRSTKPWASLNNIAGNEFAADRAEGRLRYNYFDITADGLNKEFLNNGVWNKYDGKLLVSAKCIDHGGTPWGTDHKGKIERGYTEKQFCHAWVGDIKFSSKSLTQTEIKSVGAGQGSLIDGVQLSTPDEKNVSVNVATFDACSSLFAKK